MRKYFFVGTGGFLGAISRFAIKNLIVLGGIPLATLIVNVVGSFILAFLLTLAMSFKRWDKDLVLGMSTGYLGAFTTFSALTRETTGLILAGQFERAVIYILLSTVIGLLATLTGYVTAKKLSTLWDYKGISK